MAEPVSLTFSLLALGRTAVQTATALFNFGRTVSNAKARINQLATEVELFAVLPNTLASLLQEDGSPFGPQLLRETGEQLKDCHVILDDIKKEMNGIDPKSLTVVSRAKWYFREETVNLLRARLEAAKTSLTLRVVILNLAASLKWRRESVKQHYGEAARIFETDQVAADRTSEWVQAGHGQHNQPSANAATRAASSIAAATRRRDSGTHGTKILEAIKILLAAWTIIEDTSSLPGEPNIATHAVTFADDPPTYSPQTQAGSSTASWRTAPQMPDQRRYPPFNTQAGPSGAIPLHQDNSYAESQYTNSSLSTSSTTNQYGIPFSWVREKSLPSFPKHSSLPPFKTGPCSAHVPSRKAEMGMSPVRMEHIGGREGPSVPVACMPLLSWQNSDRYWIRHFSSHALLNFFIRHEAFFHYVAVPYDAARFW